MKRTITLVLAIAAIAVPTALAQSPVDAINAQERARPNDPRVVGTPSEAPEAQGPIARIKAYERAMQRTQRLRSTRIPSIQVVQSGGFHWSDAGIGAGTAVGLMLLALGTTVVVRSGRVRSA